MKLVQGSMQPAASVSFIAPPPPACTSFRPHAAAAGRVQGMRCLRPAALVALLASWAALQGEGERWAGRRPVRTPLQAAPARPPPPPPLSALPCPPAILSSAAPVTHCAAAQAAPAASGSPSSPGSGRRLLGPLPRRGLAQAPPPPPAGNPALVAALQASEGVWLVRCMVSCATAWSLGDALPLPCNLCRAFGGTCRE